MLASSPASILNRIFGRAGIAKCESASENHALSSRLMAVFRAVALLLRPAFVHTRPMASPRST